MAMPCIYSKKYGWIMPVDQNSHHTVPRFQCMPVGFVCPKMRQSWLFIYGADMYFFSQNLQFFHKHSATLQSSSLSEAYNELSLKSKRILVLPCVYDQQPKKSLARTV